MSQAPIMPMATDAMIADTTHLSPEEFGAYHLLLYATWRNNGHPLPDEDKRLARVCRVTAPRWRRLRPVLLEFFDISDGTWRQKRLEKEWAYVAERREAQRRNGAKGGRAKALNARQREVAEQTPAPQAEPGLGTSPHTHTQTHTQESFDDEAVGLREGGTDAGVDGTVNNDGEGAFEAFWQAYPSRGAAANPKRPTRELFLAALAEGATAQELVAAAHAYAQAMAGEDNRRMIAQARTFLKEARWEQNRDLAREESAALARSKAAQEKRWAERAPRWAAIVKKGGNLPAFVGQADLDRLLAEGRIGPEDMTGLRLANGQRPRDVTPRKQA
ncbi:MAG: YdaU family protein [Pseudomonadota bacterium]